MIYITQQYKEFLGYSVPHRIWEVDADNAEEQYKEFMLLKAKKIGAVVNPHYLNIMNHLDHHSDLTLDEYFSLQKLWHKTQRQWNIDKFISEVLKGQKLDFKTINR